MCQREIESFLQKFYQLQRAGQTAHLDLDTHAGQAWVGLRVQLGHGPGQYLHPHLKKAEGPSRQRRRKKRAAARVAAEATFAAEKTVLTEKSEDITVEVKDQCTVEIVETANSGIQDTEKVLKEVTDEICADSAYNDAEEVDPKELARDKIVEKLIVSAVTKPIEEKADVENEIREKFAALGVEIKHMKTQSNYRGKFDHCIVNVSPVNLKNIWGRRLGLKN